MRHVRLFPRLTADDRGSVAPLIGLMFLVLVGCIGIAIDTGRATMVRARLVNSLDAAGLAVAARLATTDYNADAKKFVSANFATNFAGATVKTVTATPNADKSVISLTATASMPTSFMKLFGTASVDVRATTEVVRSSKGLEVVMVLDNTGSMDMSNSMGPLKDAAKLLVGQLFGDQTTAKNLYVGLVPFSQAVNIGVTRALWTDLNTVTRSYYPAYWTGCVEERLNGYDVTDDIPSALKTGTTFKAYYSPDSRYNDWIVTNWFWTSLNINYAPVQGQTGPGAFCPAVLTPMTNVKTTIVNGIDAMKAGGSTFINVGAVWGWRMLSPSWRGVWDGDMLTNKLPLDYGSKNMNKAVILMTDGENMFNENNYTSYSFLSDKRLGTADMTTANKALDAKLSTVCSSMKAKEIIVYTVAFNNPPDAIKTLLQTCATSTAFYFDAGNNEALKAAFTAIGGSLSNLRVSR
ncbi:pilus assembly protein TadG-related protein [Methylopila musalis]|uniref:Pilus assembly protein TadG-related protein n=1 Tax=Methylopila musalis TaxID=1134781 RepID=A0ABW3Z4J3_9HYPH